MNMFVRFDENPAMTLQDIKETKCCGRTHGRTDARTHRQRENCIPTPSKVREGIKTQENITYKRAKRSALSQQAITWLQRTDKKV